MRAKHITGRRFALSLPHSFLKLQREPKASSQIRRLIRVSLQLTEICKQDPGMLLQFLNYVQEEKSASVAI